MTVLPDSVSLETTRYDTWTEYAKQLTIVLRAAERVMKPGIVRRMGLRYVDRIEELRLTGAAAWAERLQAPFAGPLAHPKLGSHIQEVQQQVVFTIDDDYSCTLRHGTLSDGRRVDYLLDFDVYTTTSLPFEPEELLSRVDEMHLASKQLFYEVASNLLLSELDG